MKLFNYDVEACFHLNHFKELLGLGLWSLSMPLNAHSCLEHSGPASAIQIPAAFTNFPKDPAVLKILRRFIRSEKLQNESSPNFFEFSSRILPRILLRIFLRSFRASFRGKRRPDKIHQKSPPFFNVKFPGKLERKNPQKFSGERAE